MMARCVTLVVSLVPLVFASVSAANAAATPASDTNERGADFPGKPSDWHGFKCYDFEVDGKPVLVVAPEKPARDRPWVWHGEFFGHKPAPDIALLERGFHVVYMRIPDMLGCPAAVFHWDAFYGAPSQAGPQRRAHLASRSASTPHGSSEASQILSLFV